MRFSSHYKSSRLLLLILKVALCTRSTTFATITNSENNLELQNVDLPNQLFDSYDLQQMTATRAIFLTYFTVSTANGAIVPTNTIPANQRCVLNTTAIQASTTGILLVQWGEARLAGCVGFKHLLIANGWGLDAPGSASASSLTPAEGASAAAAGGKDSTDSAEGNSAPGVAALLPRLVVISNHPFATICCRDPFYGVPNALYVRFRSRVKLTAVSRDSMAIMIASLTTSPNMTYDVSSLTDLSTAQLQSIPFRAFLVARTICFIVAFLYALFCLTTSVRADKKFKLHIRNGMLIGCCLWAATYFTESVVFADVVLKGSVMNKTLNSLTFSASWFGITAGYTAYTLMLQRWVRISEDVAVDGRVVRWIRKFYPIFAAISIVGIAITTCIFVSALNSSDLRFRFFGVVVCTMILNVTNLFQSVAMVYYAVVLMKAFKRSEYLGVTAIKHVPIRKMTIICLTGIASFTVITLSMAILYIFAFFSTTTFFLWLITRPLASLYSIFLILYSQRQRGEIRKDDYSDYQLGSPRFGKEESFGSSRVSPSIRGGFRSSPKMMMLSPSGRGDHFRSSTPVVYDSTLGTFQYPGRY